MKDIFSVDFRGSIRKVVQRELKEKFGIKPTKEKHKIQIGCESQTSNIFGVILENVPSKGVKDDQYCNIPMFLIDAFEYLNHHLKVEGLFRKSGSVGRQKVLKEILEKDGTCCSCDFVQPHDVASLVKQFFRELPDPLLTTRLSPAFLKCVTLSITNDSISAAALCCLLLPDEHLHVLRYFIKFISEMANHSLESKMTLSNLAIVFSPNLVSTTGKDRNSEKSMKESTQVIDLLFKNSHLIGMVPDALFNKAISISQDDGGFCSSSGDELDDDVNKRGRNLQRSEKKRDRSKSITGFLRRNFKATDKNIPKHGRSHTCEKPVQANKEELQPVVKEFGEPVWKNHSDRPTKRRNNSKTNMSPVRKSPRIGQQKEQTAPVVISLPKLKSMPNQVASTPRRLLQPIQKNLQDVRNEKTKHLKVSDSTTIAAALPSKFNFSTTAKRSESSALRGTTTTRSDKTEAKLSKTTLARSKSSTISRSHVSSAPVSRDNGNTLATSATTIDNKTQQLPQSKITRATQKPHVRKSRRTSSLDRRRARYASATKVRRQLPKCPVEKDVNDSIISISDSSLVAADNAFLASRLHQQDIEETLKNDPKVSTKKVTKISKNELDINTKKIEKMSLSMQSSHVKPRVRRRLPKASSFANCQSPMSPDENKSPVTPTDRKIQRSSTSIRKPATPYSVTPQIGTRHSGHPIAFVADRQPMVL